MGKLLKFVPKKPEVKDIAKTIRKSFTDEQVKQIKKDLEGLGDKDG